MEYKINLVYPGIWMLLANCTNSLLNRKNINLRHHCHVRHVLMIRKSASSVAVVQRHSQETESDLTVNAVPK